MTLETAGFGSALPPSVREYFNANYAQKIRAPLYERLDRTVPLERVPFLATDSANWPIKDQGSRPTCTAFAAAAMMERFWRPAQAAPVSLSEQFLYFHMRRSTSPTSTPIPNYEDGATRLSQARDVLATKGVCSKEAADYPKISEAGIDGPEPEDDAVNDALTRLHSTFEYGFYPNLSDRIQGLAIKLHGLLQQGRPVAVSVPTFLTKQGVSNWKTGPAELRGIVYCPVDKAVESSEMETQPESGHAVCLVGFEPDNAEPNGGWFLFRNSWNSYFATAPHMTGPEPSVPSIGYGLMSATQVEHFVWEFLSPADNTTKH